MEKTIAVPGIEAGKLKQTSAHGTISTTKRNWLGALIGLGIICVGVILCLQAQKTPVERKAPPGTPTLDYESLIQMHADRAGRRNMAALKLFDMDVNRVISGHKGRMAVAAGEAAKAASSYGACCKLIYHLAVDKVLDKNETDAYLNQQIGPVINPAMMNMARDVDAAVNRLDYALRRSTVELAGELAALSHQNKSPDPAIDLNRMEHPDMRQALRNLGFAAAGIAVSMAFDAAAISQSRIAAILLRQVVAIGSRIFGRQVTVLSGSVAAALADGPIPVGDILGGIGILWTGYDIYDSRNEFETEVHKALRNMVDETIDDIHRQSLDHAGALMGNYQKVQGHMASQTLDQTTKGGR